MLKTLIKIRMAAVCEAMFRSSKAKKKKGAGSKAASAVGLTILFAYLAVCFLFLFGMLFFSMAGPFHELGLDWFYFAFMMMFTFALMFVGSVFMAQSVLFDAKDNELLLSLPIPASKILLSRILTVVLANLGYGAVVILPGAVVYTTVARLSVASIIMLAVSLVLMALFSTAISSLFGALIHAITSRMRSKTLVSVLLSLAFLGAYFYFYSKAYTYIQIFVANGATIAGKVQKAVLPLYWLGESLAAGDLLLFLPAALCLIVPFVLVYAGLSATFLKMATSKRGAAKVKYEEKELAVSSVRLALLKKELTHFFSIAGYILNGSLGVAFLLVATGYVLVKRNELLPILEMMPVIEPFLGLIAAAAICGTNSMNIISAPTISLEGKNLWIVSTCPVPTKDILLAKVMLHVTVCMPVTLVSAVVFGLAFPMGLTDALLMILLSVAVIVLFALFGVAVNLKLPKFDWISETACVKNSASTLVCMFGNMLFIMIPALVYALTPLHKVIGPTLFAGLCLVLVLALCAGIYRFIVTKGCEIYESL